MPSAASSINVQYGYTIGRGEQFGPGFSTPVFAARGEGDLLYVLCRASEYRPEGTRITVCTVDEEYVTTFARGVPAQGTGSSTVQLFWRFTPMTMCTWWIAAMTAFRNLPKMADSWRSGAQL